MTSIGTGYDLNNSIFSPDGQNFQVNYALKAVENGGTSIGIRCKDGVVLAVEKIVTSKLLKPGANKRIATVDTHIGATFSGLVPDGKFFISQARDEARSWRSNFNSPISVKDLADRVSGIFQVYTMHTGVRPFGITGILGGFGTSDDVPVDGEVGSGPSCGAGGRAEGKTYGGPFLYMIEPSGRSWGYYGAAAGKNAQAAKAELEKLDLAAGKLTIQEAVKEAARIIHVSQKDNADKAYELEMSWVSGPDGPTKGRHVPVPADLIKAARDEVLKAASEAEAEKKKKKEDEEARKKKEQEQEEQAQEQQASDTMDVEQ